MALRGSWIARDQEETFFSSFVAVETSLDVVRWLRKGTGVL
jgi:hypothetical protein